MLGILSKFSHLLPNALPPTDATDRPGGPMRRVRDFRLYAGVFSLLLSSAEFESGIVLTIAWPLVYRIQRRSFFELA